MSRDLISILNNLVSENELLKSELKQLREAAKRLAEQPGVDLYLRQTVERLLER